jgi:hypothetical protein
VSAEAAYRDAAFLRRQEQEGTSISINADTDNEANDIAVALPEGSTE